MASMTSSGVTPRKAIRRYVVAGSATSGPAPSRRTSGPVVTTPTRVMRTPRPMASQTPSMPWARAARRSPAPSRRATLAVVPYARKTQRPTNVWSTTAAMPSPARAAVPRWPTIAASASRNSGSATSARNAGSASRQISRSSDRARGWATEGQPRVRPEAPGKRRRHRPPTACARAVEIGGAHQPIGRLSTCRQTNPRWRVDERPFSQEISGAHPWEDVSAGQRPDPRRPGRVLHSGSPGRCTGDRRVVHGCVEVLPRLARSLWITIPWHVDRGPGKRLRSSPGRCARLMSVEVSVAPPTVTPVTSVPDPEAA